MRDETQEEKAAPTHTKTEQPNVTWMEEIVPLKTENKEEEDEDNTEDNDDMIEDVTPQITRTDGQYRPRTHRRRGRKPRPTTII